MSEERRNPETVVSGSFSRINEIRKIQERFEQSGLTVRAPKIGEVVDPNRKFVRFITDDAGHDDAEVEKDFLRDIGAADFHYVADFGGRVGFSAASEMAYARLKDKPIAVMEEIMEFSDEVPEAARPLLREAVREVLPPEGITAENVATICQRLEQVQLPTLEPEQEALLRGMIKSLLLEKRKQQE
jgi:hypothetical protein